MGDWGQPLMGQDQTYVVFQQTNLAWGGNVLVLGLDCSRTLSTAASSSGGSRLAASGKLNSVSLTTGRCFANSDSQS
uniref:Uncharacterized protein n=1 Tax=Triticum urartu TaxID=4572 RepID=A0A8R7QLD7_TRIUA